VIARTLVIGLLLVTAAVLETALFPAVALLAVRTDLLLLVVIAVALRDGPLAGLRVGAAAGLLADLLVSQSSAGLGLLVMTVIGYAIGVARPYLAPDSWTAPILLTFVASLVGTAAFGTLAMLLAEERAAPALVVEASLLVALTNTLLAPLVVGVVGRLSERFPLRGAATERAA
jgi:rod shape-determining protein MreD